MLESLENYINRIKDAQSTVSNENSPSPQSQTHTDKKVLGELLISAKKLFKKGNYEEAWEIYKEIKDGGHLELKTLSDITMCQFKLGEKLCNDKKSAEARVFLEEAKKTIDETLIKAKVDPQHQMAHDFIWKQNKIRIEALLHKINDQQ